jgi:hypothetical protein
VENAHPPVFGIALMSGGFQNPARRPVRLAAPRGVSDALAGSAVRALQHLPDELLRSMIDGLRTHADELAPGVLFRGHSSGGCAVGITLRELAPQAFEFNRLRFWLWHRWRRGVERDVARRFPRLKHLQWYFDEAVRELKEAGYPQPAKAVGLWLAATAEAELRSRRGAVAETRRLPPRTARRGARRAGGPARAREQEVETNRTQSRPEAQR